MSVLLLKLSGPLQAWGDSSRFTRRNTRREPTKSGVIGLLASAQGRSREDSIEDLLNLEYGVRIEQPGRVIRDFQTEQSVDGKKVMPLTNRYYLSDAIFLVALGAEQEVLQTIDSALRSPKWPLFLGRRACPADLPISLGIHDEYEDVREALSKENWYASSWFQEQNPNFVLEIACDAHQNEPFQSQNDLPLTFSSKGRKYATRAVFHLRMQNPEKKNHEQLEGSASDGMPSQFVADDHNPMNF